MAEGKKWEKPTTAVQNPSLNDAKNVVSSSPASLTKARSLRNNCLCSPTTHAGSFRCRYHRNGEFIRNSMSVGSKLNELGAKSAS